MKLSNAIKTLERKGFVITANEPYPSQIDGEMCPPDKYEARKEGSRRLVTLYRTGREDDVASISARDFRDEDDSRSDYFAGSYFKSLKQAIEFVERGGSVLCPM